MLRKVKSAGGAFISKVTSALGNDREEDWDERWRRRLQGGDFGISLHTVLPRALAPTNDERDAAMRQAEDTLSSLSLDTRTESCEGLFRCSTVALIDPNSSGGFEASLSTSFSTTEGNTCSLEDFIKDHDLIENLDLDLDSISQASQSQAPDTVPDEDSGEPSGFVSVTDVQNQVEKWKGEACSFTNLHCTEDDVEKETKEGEATETLDSKEDQSLFNDTSPVAERVEKAGADDSGDDNVDLCSKNRDSNNSGQDKCRNKVSPSPPDTNNHSNKKLGYANNSDIIKGLTNQTSKLSGNVNNHSQGVEEKRSRKFTGISNLAYQSSNVSWASIQVPSNIDWESVTQESEKKDNVFMKKSSSLIEGEEAFRHYKLFAAVEKSMYKKRVQMAKQQILEDYGTKISLIDDLLEVARAYYVDPTGKNRKRWKALRRDIDQSSTHSITDRRVKLAQVSSFYPFFTIIVMCLQVLICGIVISKEGIATVNTVSTVELQDNTRTILGTETVDKWEEVNMWIGFKSRVMTEMGSILAVCMRDDMDLHMMGVTRKYSHLTFLGCCEVSARNTAGTTTSDECDALTLGVGVWRNVTCNKRQTGENRVPHVLKPCCVDLKGTCSLTSKEHCAFLDGVFHEGHEEHCSQVNCPNSICGMGGITADPENKWLSTSYQWWRPLVSLIYTHGVLHLLLVLFGEVLLLRQIEKSAGWLRVAVIYCLCGIAGGMCASLFSPWEPQVGSTAAVMGSLGVIHMELIEGWGMIHKPCLELIKIYSILIFAIITGTLPSISNAAITTGFIAGMLSAVAFLPYIHLRLWSKEYRRVAVVAAVILLIILLFFVIYSFHYIQSLHLCEWCKLVECRNYVDNMCPH